MMRQATTATERLDAAKQSVSAPRRGNVGYFDRLLPTQARFAVVQDAQREDSSLARSRNPGNVGLDNQAAV